MMQSWIFSTITPVQNKHSELLIFFQDYLMNRKFKRTTFETAFDCHGAHNREERGTRDDELLK